jgi:hypothetical protein
MSEMDNRARLVTGANLLRALLAEDSDMLAALHEAFTSDELLRALIPQAMTVARKLAEHLGIPAPELGDRVIQAALLYGR